MSLADTTASRLLAELPTPPGCGGHENCDRVTHALVAASLLVVIGVLLVGLIMWRRRR
jgi:hypothetical protein